MISLINSIFIIFIKILPKSLVSIFAKQYVAGENIEDVLQAVKIINKDGLKATIDILGEHFTSEEDIRKIVSEYNELYRLIKKDNIDANISIKPTHIGLDISYNHAFSNFNKIIENVKKYENFLRIDMESSIVTDDTISLYQDLLDNTSKVGIVFQAYLHRTYEDLQKIEHKSLLNFRLCKGIYKESSNIAITDYKDINNNYLKILEYAFKNKIYVGIATHDKFLIDECYKLINKHDVNPDMFEFQVLYGVPMGGYIEKHKNKKYNVRVYVPYGKQWYEYSIRRIKENPNILIYVLKNLFKIG